MYLHWETVIQPLLERLKPDVVVEIGSDLGYNTRNLLAFCLRTGATLHAVDPLPKFDLDAWKREYPDTLVFHQETSLEALPTIESPDVVLIDGDHNWHTVYHELKALGHGVGEHAGRFPVVLLHDVGWPYGRRDLYYAPERIPEPDRQPYGEGGLRPGREDLDRGGGLNAHLLNALREGGPRNGVLTAVEDYILEAPLELDFIVVPGIHDLGVLVSSDLRSGNPALSEFIQQLDGTPALRRVLERVERLRVESLIDALDRKRELEKSLTDALDRKRELENARSLIAETKASLESERQQRIQQETTARIRSKSLMQERDQIAAQSKRLRSELAAHIAAHSRSGRTQEARIKSLEEREAQLIRDKDRLSRRFDSLRRRRSVRLALGVAGLGKPLFTLAKRSRARTLQRSLPPSTVEVALRAQRETASAPTLEPATATGPSHAHVGSADVVVCIHNAMEDVQRCLASLVEMTSLVSHRLILVDDGSDEPVRHMLDEFAAKHPVTLIRNEEAQGYTVAANQGIEVSENPYVVLLNSDTVVGPGWLEKLIRCAESTDRAGVVGPFSNAASWQSVPMLTNPDGSWHLNPLPEGASPSDVATLVDRWSPRLYPEVPLVNGFCYLITREALEKVGRLDDQTFPRGYGEEDDFSLRCAKAGLKLYVADDCYVYHAKSRSHTAEGRKALVVQSKELLREKHGADLVDEIVGRVRSAEDLIRTRSFVGEAMKLKEIGRRENSHHSQPVVGWLQPHLEQAGGIRRAIEMTNRLLGWGFRTILITPDGWQTDWLPVVSEVMSVDQARSMTFDVLIGSDPDMVWPFLELTADRKVNYHLAPYMLYRSADDSLQAYYDRGQQITHVANSKWTAEQIQAHVDLSIEAVFPGGVDKRLFHPMRVERSHDIVCHGSLREHKGTEEIERATSDLSLLKMEQHNAPQHHLARLINSGRVYVSAAWHEGFNMAALEAMACGVPVVMTDDGGSREYANDGQNALVVEPRDPVALRQQIQRALDDSVLRANLIEGGMRTAWAFDWDDITADFADLLVAIT